MDYKSADSSELSEAFLPLERGKDTDSLANRQRKCKKRYRVTEFLCVLCDSVSL